MDNELRELTDNDYEDFIQDGACLVLLFKEKCPNCKVMKKVIAKCGSNLTDLKLASLNSETNPIMIEKLEITRVPTLLLYHDGELKGRKSGIIKVPEVLNFCKKA